MFGIIEEICFDRVISGQNSRCITNNPAPCSLSILPSFNQPCRLKIYLLPPCVFCTKMYVQQKT